MVRRVGKSMEDQDVVLMLEFQAGDDRAFSTLVEKHQKSVVNFFFFQCRDLDRAEDCAQEVWVRVFKARDSYHPGARFRTWLFRVARNYWIDVYRSLKRRPREETIEADEGRAESGTSLRNQLAASAAPPSLSAERNEMVRQLAEGLSRLSSDMREVFLLAEVEGLPYAQIAEILEVPEGTIKSRMFNAVRKLRDHCRNLKPT